MQDWVIIINCIARIHYANRLKEKKMILINIVKDLIIFDYLLQNYQQTRVNGPFCNMTKGIFKKTLEQTS